MTSFASGVEARRQGSAVPSLVPRFGECQGGYRAMLLVHKNVMG